LVTSKVTLPALATVAVFGVILNSVSLSLIVDEPAELAGAALEVVELTVELLEVAAGAALELAAELAELAVELADVLLDEPQPAIKRAAANGVINAKRRMVDSPLGSLDIDADWGQIVPRYAHRMADRRPTIGICAALERAKWGAWDRAAALLPFEYLLEIQRAGGLALMIAPDERLITEPDEVLDQLDGLILAGGADIDPAAYDAEPHPETNGIVPERDQVELALTRAAVERDMPVLGICRGMQMVNVALGGTLDQHTPDTVGHTEHRRNRGTFDGNEHDVDLTPGSLAA
jgi:hypothetical protein